MTVVADASPIIALAQIHQLDLLHQLFGPIDIPPAVYAEVADSPDLASGIPGWARLRTATDSQVVDGLRQQLDTGEAEAVALALEQRALLIIDERRGRRVAQALSIPRIGTLGVLVRAKKRGLIDVARPLIDQLRAVEFWVSETVVERA